MKLTVELRHREVGGFVSVSPRWYWEVSNGPSRTYAWCKDQATALEQGAHYLAGRKA